MTQSAEAGWYPHPSMVATHCYWDGERWTDNVAPATPRTKRPERPESPGNWIFVGALSTGFSLAAAMIAVNTPGGWVLYPVAVILGILGWVAMMAGTIAIGVRMGARWADYERPR